MQSPFWMIRLHPCEKRTCRPYSAKFNSEHPGTHLKVKAKRSLFHQAINNF